MRLRLPMMGHGFGPGGRFSLRRWLRKRVLRRRMDANMAARYMANGKVSIAIGN